MHHEPRPLKTAGKGGLPGNCRPVRAQQCFPVGSSALPRTRSGHLHPRQQPACRGTMHWQPASKNSFRKPSYFAPVKHLGSPRATRPPIAQLIQKSVYFEPKAKTYLRIPVLWLTIRIPSEVSHYAWSEEGWDTALGRFLRRCSNLLRSCSSNLAFRRGMYGLRRARSAEPFGGNSWQTNTCSTTSSIRACFSSGMEAGCNAPHLIILSRTSGRKQTQVGL